MGKLLAVLLFLWLVISLTGTETFAFRCSGELVSVGDRMAEVVQKCGPPDAREIRDEERYFRIFPEGRFIGILQEVEVEEWTYNLGPNRFLRFLRFENGRLAKIKTGDYGY